MADARPVSSPQSAPRRDQRGDIQDTRRFADMDEEAEGEHNRVRDDFWADEIMPPCPRIKGFHTIWLSSTNSQDSIAKRMRMGYVAVKADELPASTEYATVESGRFQGCVSFAEFVLHKIPHERYVRIMEQNHHKVPLAREAGIRRQVEAFRNTGSEGLTVAEVFGGTDSLGRQPQRRVNFEN